MSERQNSALRRPLSGQGSRRPAATVTTTGATELYKTGGSGRHRPSHSMTPATRTAEAQALRVRILQHMERCDLVLSITSNKTVMISVNRQPRHRRYKVRLHHMFVGASDEMVAHLASYIVHNDHHASQQLGAFIDARPIKGPQPRQPTIRTEGRWYDLTPLFHELNARYFQGALTCRISWGRHVGRGRARRTIRLGSYTVEDELIRVHPGLDQEWVPDFYLRWVIFHEMLHAAVPITRVNGRRRIHPPELKQAERAFEQRDLAVAWEQAHIPALLSI